MANNLEAKRIARRHNSGAVMGSLLRPNVGIRDEMRRCGLTPKNHMSVNYRTIKEIEEKNREELLQREMEANKEPFILPEFRNVKSAVFRPAPSNINDEEVPEKKHTYLKKREGINIASLNKYSPSSNLSERRAFCGGLKQSLNFSKNLIENEEINSAKLIKKNNMVVHNDYGTVPKYIEELKEEKKEKKKKFQKKLKEKENLHKKKEMKH